MIAVWLWWIAVAGATPAEPLVEEAPSVEAGEGAAGAASGRDDAGEVGVTEGAGPDRSQPPEVQRSPLLELGEPEVHRLGPGVEAWYVPVDGVRRVSVQVLVHRGTYELVGWPTVTAQTMGNLMDVATSRYPADALSERADLHEVELYSWLGHHHGGVSLSVPGEGLDVGLDLLGEVLRAPVYPAKDLRRDLRDQRNFYQITGPASPRAVAHAAMTYAWLPADHPYGARPDLKALKRVKRAEVARLHDDWTRAGPITVIVASSLPWPEIEGRLAPIVRDLGREGLPSEPLDVDVPVGRRIVAVDMPGQRQATLMLRLPAPDRDDDDRVPFEVANYALGGHFLSRLNANLREDKGFTYGTRSTYAPGARRGHVTISVDVAVDNTAAAVREIRHELETLASDGPTADEIEWAIRARTFGWNETRATADSTRRFYDQRAVLQETVADAAAREERARSLELSQVAEVASRWLAEDTARVWVVVGDRGRLQGQLEELGWAPEWVDPPAAVLGVL